MGHFNNLWLELQSIILFKDENVFKAVKLIHSLKLRCFKGFFDAIEGPFV